MTVDCIIDYYSECLCATGKYTFSKYIFFSEDLFVYFEAQPKNSSDLLRDNAKDPESCTLSSLWSQRLFNSYLLKIQF